MLKRSPRATGRTTRRYWFCRATPRRPTFGPASRHNPAVGCGSDPGPEATGQRETSMNEREALLRAVCENPDDDTPRLVFADWLQENGEEDRAEFIRLQIRLADRYTIAMNMMAGQDAEYDRAKALQEQFGAMWLGELTEHECWRLN